MADRASYRGRGRGSGGPPPHHGQRRDGGGAFQGPLIYPPNKPVSLAPRLTDDSQDALLKRFKNVGGKVVEMPHRPGYGSLGIKTFLRANFFDMKLPKGPLYDYSVTITDVTPRVHDGGKGGKGGKGRGKPQPPSDSGATPNIKAPIKRRIFELLEEDKSFQPYKLFVVHDYSQRIVAAKTLPQPLKLTITFREEDEAKSDDKKKALYELSVEFLGEIDLEPVKRHTEGDLQYRELDVLQPALSALNLILQYQASHTGVRLGKKDSNGATKYFFNPKEISPRIRLSPGVQAWRGFFISVRPTFRQLMVNVNISYAAFMEPRNLAEVLLEVGSLPGDMIGGIKVRTQHLGHRRKIVKMGRNSARNEKITVDGKQMSVEEYFKQRYKKTLKYATNLPLVCLGHMDKGGEKIPVWVPAELCDIVPGSARTGKLTKDETSNMIRLACNPPAINAKCLLEEGLPILGFSTQKKAPILASFGIDIGQNMADIPARILPPPKLSYRSGPASVRNGAWNILDVKFLRGAKVGSYWALYVDDASVAKRESRPPGFDQLTDLVHKFRNKCATSGMEIPGTKPPMLKADLNAIRGDDPMRTRALRLLQDTIEGQKAKTGKPSFILVLLRGVDKYIYAGMKRICDVTLGIHTVHMLLDTALDQKKQDQYLSNVALKVNTKLGGINHKLEDSAMSWLRTKSTMMVGIDVTHAGPGTQKGTPSIAAVVASIDDSFVHFPASLRIQKHAKNKETLDELQDMMIERLQVYSSTNKGKLPERVFVFRDGVSEGQFSSVLREELPQIREAFKRVRDGYKPLLSIIICGKRHHAKAFATDEKHVDKKGNTTPGTVVDRGITAVFDFDFYLQAHAGLQGTVKMTHYTIIYDETHFSADEIQKGTNDTSYLYGRATRSVSLIPAAYYADIACERGRCYLNDFLNVNDSATASVRSGKSDEERERQRVFEEAKKHWGNGVHGDLRGSMFYL